MKRRWILLIAAPLAGLGAVAMHGSAQTSPQTQPSGDNGGPNNAGPNNGGPSNGGPNGGGPDGGRGGNMGPGGGFGGMGPGGMRGGFGPRGGPDGGGPGGLDNGGPGGGFGGFGGRGGGGPDGGRGGHGGPMDRRMPSMDVMRGFLELVDRYSDLSKDPDAAGVSAVLAANDIQRAKGNDAAIAYFTKQLDVVRRPAIRRAIRLQLVDLYKAAGKGDEAMAQLELLMHAPVADVDEMSAQLDAAQKLVFGTPATAPAR